MSGLKLISADFSYGGECETRCKQYYNDVIILKL